MIDRIIFTTLTMAACLFVQGSHAQVVDYPTLDRILFIEECIQMHPEKLRQEMVYKCSCMLDSLADEIPYADYTELATAAHASTIAGERGSAMRGDDVLALAKRYRTSVAKAGKVCLLAP